MTTDERLQRLTQALNLTDDQQQKIRPILENETQQLDALHQNTALTGQDRRDKMLSIRDVRRDDGAPRPAAGNGTGRSRPGTRPATGASTAVVLEDCHYERSEEPAFFCRVTHEWEKQIPHGLKAVRNDNSVDVGRYSFPSESPPTRTESNETLE
jgi:hypothetical protein